MILVFCEFDMYCSPELSCSDVYMYLGHINVYCTQVLHVLYCYCIFDDMKVLYCYYIFDDMKVVVYMYLGEINVYCTPVLSCSDVYVYLGQIMCIVHRYYEV